MTAMTPTKATIWGSSDDCICIQGLPGGNEEFYGGGEDGEFLAFSDGTVLRVKYDNQGCWRIRQVVAGTAPFVIEFSPEDDEDEGGYSDRVTLDGVTWVQFCGEDGGWARALASADRALLSKARAVLEALTKVPGYEGINGDENKSYALLVILEVLSQEGVTA